MKLSTMAVFAALATFSGPGGRERYEQLRELARGASGGAAASGARQRLEEYGARLETYAAQSRLAQSRLGQSAAGTPGAGRPGAGRPGDDRARGSPAARQGPEAVARPDRDPARPPAGPPQRTPRSLTLHRRHRRPGQGQGPGQGDLVIGAFVLARLLGIRLLTLEARVVVHGDERGEAPPAPLLLAPVPAGRVPPGPARYAAPRAALAGPGADQLALAVRLVEQGADTLERTRRSQRRS